MRYLAYLFLTSLLLLGGYLMINEYRNSRTYHISSKLLYPVTENLAIRAPHIVSKPIKSSDFLSTKTDRWRSFNPHFYSIKEDTAESFIVKANSESVWYQNQQGGMLYLSVGGDFEFSVNILAEKSSQPNTSPDKDWQFAGIIVRDPNSDLLMSRENYIFNAIGHRKKRLQLETKNTIQGYSDVNAFDWESAQATVKIQRQGDTFTLWAKSQNQDWKIFNSLIRPDMPISTQLGLIIYSYSEGAGRVDLQARFSDMHLIINNNALF